MFFYILFALLSIPHRLSLQNFQLSLFFLLVPILNQQNNEVALKIQLELQFQCIRISYSKDSNNSVVLNKQPRNPGIDRLFVKSIIKFVITVFVALSSYQEHYPNRVNYVTFLVNSMNHHHHSHTPVVLGQKTLTLSTSKNIPR